MKHIGERKKPPISVKNNLYTAALRATVDHSVRIIFYILLRQYEIPVTRESKDRYDRKWVWAASINPRIEHKNKKNTLKTDIHSV